jgi:predicted PurR-regulated permease PerM
MNPETEKLLRTWLKYQIWEFRFSVLRWLITILLFVAGVIGFFGFALPSIRAELKNLQGQFSQVSEQTQKQKQILEQIEESLGQEKDLFNLFLE